VKDACSRQGELPARPAAQRTPCNLAGASEVIFALTRALGYRWAPRLADLPDLRLWRIDRHAHYGPLDGLARNHINTWLIAEHWDTICRLTASLRAGTSSLRRSCAHCNAALPLPASPAPWPNSAG
jgi:TnpA family transposase